MNAFSQFFLPNKFKHKFPNKIEKNHKIKGPQTAKQPKQKLSQNLTNIQAQMPKVLLQLCLLIAIYAAASGMNDFFKFLIF
jgi:hypothetical protein